MFGWRLRRIMDNLKHWSQKCLRHQFSLPTNPSFLLWFEGSDIVTYLPRRKDGLLLSFVLFWIITLSFFIWPFISLKCFSFCIYNHAGFSFIIYTAMTALSPSAILPFHSYRTSWGAKFSNLKQTLIWAIPYQHRTTNCIQTYDRTGF